MYCILEILKKKKTQLPPYRVGHFWGMFYIELTSFAKVQTMLQYRRGVSRWSLCALATQRKEHSKCRYVFFVTVLIHVTINNTLWDNLTLIWQQLYLILRKSKLWYYATWVVVVNLGKGAMSLNYEEHGS